MTNASDIQLQLKSIGLDGWLEDWDVLNIYNEVSSLKPGQTYLEIGVARGKSASIACLAAKEGVNIIGVDEINWGDRDENIKKFLELNNKQFSGWQFIEGDSQVTAKYWSKNPIDLLFIDGDHTYEGVMRDMFSWIPWVEFGGTIMFDDYNEVTGVKKAIDDLLFEHGAFSDFKIDGEMFICKKL